jgi:hypothetical protein
MTTDTNTNTNTSFWIDGKGMSRWTIVEEAKGWVTLTCIAGDVENDPDGEFGAVGDTCKARRKQLTPCEEPTPTEDTSDAAEAAFSEAGERAWPEADPEMPDSETLAGLDEDDATAEDDDGELTIGKLMGRTLRQYATAYVVVTNAAKTKTKVCGDALSLALKDLTPDEVADLASGLLEKPVDLYDHLNPGQVRMNWGNRLRAAVKRGDLDPEVVMAEIEILVKSIARPD